MLRTCRSRHNQNHLRSTLYTECVYLLQLRAHNGKIWRKTPSKKQTDKRTKRQTDRRQESNFIHFILKMWHLLAIILMIFPIINCTLTKFRVFISLSRIFIPLNFLWSIAIRQRMDANDRHNEQTDRDNRTEKCVSLSVCVLDGVWHYLKASKVHILKMYADVWLGETVSLFSKV